ncbi:MAG: UDP-4-amino-4,6-dideoxy-N-acetyl-beta-L-altrosamine transaminase [Actinobacteria bacterium]|nr:MAG: UDP-4-amino-4,6-dideoxy-N-acetyl-beta-L-altrosamine transaminase [Actinomycetota bacterium]
MAVPYGHQAVDDADIQAVVDVLRGEWLTQGPAVAAFEETFAERCGAPYAVAFSSGTAALHAAAFAAGIGPGDELVTSALTFAASANCGAYLGATPRFADIDRSTWNVTAETIAASVGPRTRVVIPVHFAGLPAPVEDIRDALAENVTIIEDAAHALGAHRAGAQIGSCRHSHMTTFSFHPVKAIAAGEGGMVTTRDPQLRERLTRFRNHGLTNDRSSLTRDEGAWYAEQQDLGFNYRLSDIHSALGRSQLAKLDRYIELRNVIAARYRESLDGIGDLVLPPEAPADSLHAYHLFIVQHCGGREARRRLYGELHERGILVQVHYLPVYLHPWYRRLYGYEPGLCPEAERYYAGCLSLPCFPGLTEEDQRLVVDTLWDLCA